MNRSASAPFTGRLGTFEAVLVGLLATIPIVVLAFAVPGRPGEEAYWFGLLLCAVPLLFPLLLAAFRRHLDALEPIYITCASFLLYLVYAPARDMLEGKEFFFGLHIPPMMPRASALAALGLVCMLIGYYAPWAGRSTRRMRSFVVDERMAVMSALAIGFVAAAMFSAGIAASGLSWLDYLTLGQLGVSADQALSIQNADSPFLSYMLAAADSFTPAFMMLFAFVNRRRGWLLLALLPIAAVYTTIGFRYKLVILLLAPVVFRYLQSGKRPRTITLAAAALAAFLVIGVIGSQRLYIRAGQPIDTEALSITEAREAFDRDVSLYQPFAAVVHAYPEWHDHLWGSSMAYVLVHPIPRSLWTEKPTPPVWEILETSFNSRDAVIAGVAYPNMGEYYANFGTLGIVFGMFLFGAGMRALYAYALRNRDNKWAGIIYALALPFLVQFVSRGYLVAMVQYIAFLFGPIILVMVLLRRRAALRRTAPVPTPVAGRLSAELP